MRAKELFQSGHVAEAVQALNAELRDNPTDAKRRTFLFELLCFTGEYDCAEKQLNILAGDNSQTELGAVIYHSALHAERVRQQMFRDKSYPAAVDSPLRRGTLNGQAFTEIRSARGFTPGVVRGGRLPLDSLRAHRLR